MSAKVESGQWSTIWFPKKASTVFTANEFVNLESGYLNPGDSSSATLVGINQDRTVAATDSDYASTTLLPIMVPRGPECQVRATASGALAATSVGVEYDLTDSVTVNEGSTSNPCVTCTKYISTTEGLFSITNQLGQT